MNNTKLIIEAIKTAPVSTGKKVYIVAETWNDGELDLVEPLEVWSSKSAANGRKPKLKRHLDNGNDITVMEFDLDTPSFQ